MLRSNAVALQKIKERLYRPSQKKSVKAYKGYVVNITVMDDKDFEPFTLTTVGNGLWLLEQFQQTKLEKAI